jgi:hypothetical protein
MSESRSRMVLRTPERPYDRLAAPFHRGTVHQAQFPGHQPLGILGNTWYGQAMLQRFSIWIDKKTLASLKAISKEKERPVGWIMRKAIEEFVENAKNH